MPIHPLLSLPLASLALSSAAMAQDAGEDAEVPPAAFPETEIFLFDYDAEASDNALSGGGNVTNRKGYDNQPHFTPGSATILYSRDDGTQTDIWEYDIASGTHTQITAHPASEFSPTPSADNRRIAMVIDETISSVWQVDRDAPGEPEWLMEPSGVVEPIGYFALAPDRQSALYWSRYGFSVSLTYAGQTGSVFVAGNALPSTPSIVPGTDHFSFVHRQTNGEVWIKAVDPATRAVRPITAIPGTNANYAWAPDGSILQIEGTALNRWRESSGGWSQIADLAEHGVASAGRIAVSPDGKRIAVVGLPAE